MLNMVGITRSLESSTLVRRDTGVGPASFTSGVVWVRVPCGHAHEMGVGGWLGYVLGVGWGLVGLFHRCVLEYLFVLGIINIIKYEPMYR